MILLEKSPNITNLSMILLEKSLNIINLSMILWEKSPNITNLSVIAVGKKSEYYKFVGLYCKNIEPKSGKNMTQLWILYDIMLDSHIIEHFILDSYEFSAVFSIFMKYRQLFVDTIDFFRSFLYKDQMLNIPYT